MVVASSRAGACATAGAASAQEAQPASHEEATQVDEVIVTATRRETVLQDTPIAISVLGAAGFFRIGVPVELGGTGGSTWDAAEAIARVAEHSLTAAFVFWGQRCFIGYLLESDNAALRQRSLPALLACQAGFRQRATQAMRFAPGA